MQQLAFYGAPKGTSIFYFFIVRTNIKSKFYIKCIYLLGGKIDADMKYEQYESFSLR